MKKLILASNSPRRKEFLKTYGYDFQVVPSGFEEKTLNLSPKQTVLVNAEGKAKEVFDKFQEDNVVVLGADTVVELDGKILGKPKDGVDAKNMLLSLSGKTHSVWTGYAIISKNAKTVNAVQTKVTFKKLSSSIIDGYVASGLPLDKAGAYGIQDGFDLVESCEGSFNNVVGLPIEIFDESLKKIMGKN